MQTSVAGWCTQLPQRPATCASRATGWCRGTQLQAPSRRQARQHCRPLATAAAEPVGKLISKAEIPAFIPRRDLIDQLLTWAAITAEESGARNFGLPMRVARIIKDGELAGFRVSIVRDGAKLTDLSVQFDEEDAVKSEWLGRGPEGFPTMEGNQESVKGKHFVIRKDDDNKIDEETRSVIRTFCQQLVAAINKYYAFGSCFVDDAV